MNTPDIENYSFDGDWSPIHHILYSTTVNNDQLGDNYTKSYRNSNEGIM